jgi:CheY-like chemotaxis protein
MQYVSNARKGQKIIAVTASALKGDHKACLAAEIDGYTSKSAIIPDV